MTTDTKPVLQRWLGRLMWAAAGGVVAALLFFDPLGLRGPGAAHDMEPPEPAAVEEAQEAVLWTCSMHPHVLEEEPGQCPICGMNLVPVARPASSPEAGEAADEPAETSPVVTLDPGLVQKMNVRTAVAERSDLSRDIRTVGYLEYDQERMVTVTTKYGGWIEEVFVNYIGEPVKKGQPLFAIYSPELIQTEQELLSATEYARSLAGSPGARAPAEALVDAARTRLSYWDISAEQIARLEASGEILRTLDVVAPASGLVMKRTEGLEGMAVKPGMEVYHIADLSSLWLSVEAFEEQVAWIDVGTRGEATFAYFPGETFHGTVGIVEPEFSETTRTLRVKLEVPNPRGRLRPGMFATVVFRPVAAAGALSVPSLAVLRTGERDVVVVDLGGGRFEPREVVLGFEAGSRVEVREGLAEGDRVVTSAQFLIDSEASFQGAIEKMMAERHGGHGDAG